jgi:hypothetical protein
MDITIIRSRRRHSLCRQYAQRITSFYSHRRDEDVTYQLHQRCSRFRLAKRSGNQRSGGINVMNSKSYKGRSRRLD